MKGFYSHWTLRFHSLSPGQDLLFGIVGYFYWICLFVKRKTWMIRLKVLLYYVMVVVDAHAQRVG